MTYSEIINAIEQEAPIERTKQWHEGESIYVTIRCPETAKFNDISDRYNGLVPEGRKSTETILITRRA